MHCKYRLFWILSLSKIDADYVIKTSSTPPLLVVKFVKVKSLTHGLENNTKTGSTNPKPYLFEKKMVDKNLEIKRVLQYKVNKKCMM